MPCPVIGLSVARLGAWREALRGLFVEQRWSRIPTCRRFRDHRARGRKPGSSVPPRTTEGVPF
eukprot:3941394-Rhodomonas_salina.1